MEKILKEMGWGANTTGQKKAMTAFGLFAACTLMFCWSWLCIPFGVGAFISFRKVKGCNVEE